MPKPELCTFFAILKKLVSLQNVSNLQVSTVRLQNFIYFWCFCMYITLLNLAHKFKCCGSSVDGGLVRAWRLGICYSSLG